MTKKRVKNSKDLILGFFSVSFISFFPIFLDIQDTSFFIIISYNSQISFTIHIPISHSGHVLHSKYKIKCYDENFKLLNICSVNQS